MYNIFGDYMSIKSKKDKNKETEVDILDTIFQRLEKNKKNVDNNSSSHDSNKIKEKYKNGFDDLFGYDEKKNENILNEEVVDDNIHDSLKKNKSKDEINSGLSLLFSSNNMNDDFVNKDVDNEKEINNSDEKMNSISNINISVDEVKSKELFEKTSEETLSDFEDVENTFSNLKITDISEAANKLFFNKDIDEKNFLDKIPDDDISDDDVDSAYSLDEYNLDESDNESKDKFDENNNDSSEDNFAYSSIENDNLNGPKLGVDDIVCDDNQYSDDELNYDYDMLEKELNKDEEKDISSNDNSSDELDVDLKDNFNDEIDDNNNVDDDSENEFDNEKDSDNNQEDKKLKEMFSSSEDFESTTDRIKASVLERLASVITFLLGIGFLVYSVLFCDDQPNNLFIIINASIVFGFTTFNLIKAISTKVSVRKGLNVVCSLFIFIFLLFNILIMTKIVKLPTQELLRDFTNVKITDALKWAKEKNIDVYQKYEYSDNIEEYNIISQDLPTTTLLKKVHEITFTVSSGPNYEKVVSVPNMVGWHIDKALKIIEENFLKNVIIDYEINNEISKDTIISQSFSGQMRRNDELKILISLGREEDLTPVQMIDLKGKKLFDATLWLKRNGFKYELFYVFSDDYTRDYVVGVEAEVGKTYDPKKDKIKLIVSKGKSIIVPDLTKMSIEEITEWITENNLKVEFNTEYSSTIEKGKVISVSHKEKDEVESGALIKVTTSLGPLKMPKIKTLDEFRNWAATNKINFIENYEFNKDVKNGDVIRTVPSEGAVVNYSDTVNIYISYGAPVSIPNFIGKSRSDAQNECNNVGLNCSFYYNDHSDTPYDIVQNQNKVAGAEVVAGTYVSIGLSSGPVPAPTPTPEPQPTPTPDPTPTPTPDPTPVCDKSITDDVYLEVRENGEATKNLIQIKYSNIKWNFVLVDKCSNGSSTPGEICNGYEIDGQALNHCDTYTITIVK